MPRYSIELKDKIIKQMIPPQNFTIKELSEKYNISKHTLYKWKKTATQTGTVIQNSSQNHKYSNEAKLNIIIETANLNQHQLSEYCRTKGIYIDDIATWKKQFISGSPESEEQAKKELKSKDDELKAVKKDLNRKEKALAEAAALLVLRKKVQAIWNSDEED